MVFLDVTDRMVQLAHLHHNEPNRDCPLCPPCCYGDHCRHVGGCHCLIARDGTHYSCKCGPPGVEGMAGLQGQVYIQELAGPPGPPGATRRG